MKSEMPPGARRWTMQLGPRNQCKELEPLLREGGVVDGQMPISVPRGGHTLWTHTDWGLNPSPILTNCVTLGHSQPISKPQFPHVKNGHLHHEVV